MITEKSVKGFRFDQVGNKALLPFAQSSVEIFLATDAAPDTWTPAFSNPMVRIGNGLEETSIDYMPAPVDA